MGRNLQIPRSASLGAGTAKALTIQQKWDTVDEVEAEILKKGLVNHAQPQFMCPELTADSLTTTDSRSYTETYVHLLSWFTYSSEILAQVQARIVQYDNMLEILAAEHRKAERQRTPHGAKPPTVEERKDLLLLNPDYQEVLHKLQRYQQSKITLTAQVDSIERSLRVISRQVEIRRLDQDQSRTGSNIPQRGYQPPPQNWPARPPVLGGPTE
jgi:hypothetical protein